MGDTTIDPITVSTDLEESAARPSRLAVAQAIGRELATTEELGRAARNGSRRVEELIAGAPQRVKA